MDCFKDLGVSTRERGMKDKAIVKAIKSYIQGMYPIDK